MARSVHEPPTIEAEGQDNAVVRDEKKAPIDTESGDGTELDTGHLQELEVDLGLIVKEGGLIDIEGDQSPYPEGKSTIIFSYFLY